MSKLTKTDLKTLAKFIVEENKKIEEQDSIKKNDKIKKKLNNILQDEECKNNFIEDFLNDILDLEENNYIDLDFLTDEYKYFFNYIEDLEQIINDMNKEAKEYTKKIFDKYSYIINQKLIDKGY
tara:strand:+ start:560 stop:931 length:372 start_codon:yes stop_codon:yes gene_type:complete